MNDRVDMYNVCRLKVDIRHLTLDDGGDSVGGRRSVLYVGQRRDG